MGLTRARACYGGGRAVTLLTASCDAPGCAQLILIASRAEYEAAAETGWRRDGDQAWCPSHARDHATPS